MILVSLLAIVVGIGLGVPIPLVFLGVTVILVWMTGTDPSFLVPYAAGRMSNPVLLAFPMFILAGYFMSRGRIGDALVNFIEIFVGRIRGGVGAVLVIACAFFGAITGSVAATASAMGAVMFPRLAAAGYPRGYAAALVANASILGILIPPSGLMIVYCWIAGQSIVAVFAAILLPGLMTMTLLVVANFILARVYLPRDGHVSSFESPPLTVTRRSVGAAPALAMPVLILGGIYSGIMTPTEAAALSAVYAVPVGLWIYRGLTWRGIRDCLVETSVMAGTIIVMMMAAMMLSRLYTMEGIPQQVLGFMLQLTDQKWLILLLINVFVLMVGMLMDDLSGILLAAPLLNPVLAPLGIDPVHFAVILSLNLGLGLLTPPMAPVLYFSGHMNSAQMSEMMGPAFLFILLAWLPALVIVTYVPELSLWLPYDVMGLR